MKRADFFSNTGGLNITDSPFMVQDGQATGGYNYDFLRTGGFQKRRGHSLLSASPITDLNTLGMGVYNPNTGSKVVLRAASTHLQSIDTLTGAGTTLSEDTLAAGTDFFSSSSVQPVVFSNFNTATTNLTWLCGGGASTVYAYNGSKVTQNGVPAPTGSLSGVAGGSGGSFTTTGTYYYSIGLRKASTLAVSNAALDTSVTVSATTQKVTLTLPAVSDTTKYDQIWVYRSAVSGFSGFTTGDIVAKIASTSATYVDSGAFLSTAQNIPRAGSTTLDNSTLPAGTYNVITTFKRRLIVASASTVYFSDLDKPESWPINNFISLPTGGPITALSVIGYNAYFSGNTDEYLVIFKEREIWVVTGDNASSWILKFIDTVGAAAHRLVVPANGYISWVDYRGIYMWSGSGKPIYISRPIESLFAFDGDLDKKNLALGWGQFFRKQNQIIWYVSHRTQGIQKIAIKLDIRLTIPRATESIDQKIIEGIFSFDSQPALYAGVTLIPPSDSEEQFYAGDLTGNIYKLFYSGSDAGSGIDFSYLTRDIDMGSPGIAKRYYKVVVFVEELGAFDLQLDYWANYRNSPLESTTNTQNISPVNNPFRASSPAVWDLAYWDIAEWDLYQPKVKSLVFNLNSSAGNNEGDSIKLKLSNSNVDNPIIIQGYSIFFDEIAVRK